MNMKKAVVLMLAVATAMCVSARPHGGWCGPRGGHHWGGHHWGGHHYWGGPRWGGPYYHGYYHHRGYYGLGLAAGIVGLSAATAAVVSDVVAPPVVYSAPTVYSAPAVVAPAPVVYSAPVVCPRVYRRW